MAHNEVVDGCEGDVAALWQLTPPARLVIVGASTSDDGMVSATEKEASPRANDAAVMGGTGGGTIALQGKGTLLYTCPSQRNSQAASSLLCSSLGTFAGGGFGLARELQPPWESKGSGRVSGRTGECCRDKSRTPGSTYRWRRRDRGKRGQTAADNSVCHCDYILLRRARPLTNLTLHFRFPQAPAPI